MSTTLKGKMNALDPRRRAKVERRAEQLISEEMSLQQLRRGICGTTAAGFGAAEF